MSEKRRLIITNDEAQQRLVEGVKKLTEAVGSTLGAKGRNVVIDRGDGEPTVTKDGVTVARSIKLSDPIENIGAQMVTSVAAKAESGSGDGTTTATVLTEAIALGGLKNVAAGANAMDVKRGVDKAVEGIVKNLQDNTEEVDAARIRQVAIVSANNDEVIGGMIADAKEAVGSNGIVTLRKTNLFADKLDVELGMGLNQGFLSRHFADSETSQKSSLKNNPYVLLFDGVINLVGDLLPVVEKVLEAQGSLYIMCQNMEGEALSSLALNNTQGVLKSCVVKSPNYNVHSIMDDLAIITGATVISESKGKVLKETQLSDLGRAESIVTSKDMTVITGGGGDEGLVKNRVSHLQEMLENPDLVGWDREEVEQRLAKLDGGVAVIHVGGKTEAEVGERYDRYVDSLSAVNSAEEEGIVPGGGVALVRAADSLVLKGDNADEDTGISLVKKACEAPFSRIINNSGNEQGQVILAAVRSREGDWGYNSKTNVYEYLYATGIVDPVKVTRVALESAASVATLIFTTSCVVSMEK